MVVAAKTSKESGPPVRQSILTQEQSSISVVHLVSRGDEEKRESKVVRCVLCVCGDNFAPVLGR